MLPILLEASHFVYRFHTTFSRWRLSAFFDFLKKNVPLPMGNEFLGFGFCECCRTSLESAGLGCNLEVSGSWWWRSHAGFKAPPPLPKTNGLGEGGMETQQQFYFANNSKSSRRPQKRR